jgi:YbbR domain-containing protein
MKTKLKDRLTENFSYKMVALFIALILWVTILGRRDFILTKNLEVEVMVGTHYIVANQNVEHVRVKVSGPRTALKKFIDSGVSQLILVDATTKPEGEYELNIPMDKIDVPFGVKVLQVKPTTIKAKIEKKD